MPNVCSFLRSQIKSPLQNEGHIFPVVLKRFVAPVLAIVRTVKWSFLSVLERTRPPLIRISRSIPAQTQEGPTGSPDEILFSD